MKNKLNEDIVTVIKKHLPADARLNTYLMQLLSLPKESVYRRIRGEIPFSFDEIATMSSAMGFSVDTTLGLQPSRQVIYHANLHQNQKSDDVSYLKLYQYTMMYREMCRGENAESLDTKNFIPYAFSLHHEILSKFRSYEWVHHKRLVDLDCSMEDYTLSPQFIDIRKQWLAIDKTRLTSIFLLSNNIISSMIRSIEYFYNASLINNSELEMLRGDLYSLIDSIDQTARTGIGPGDEQVVLYLLPLDPVAVYAHTQWKGKEVSSMQIHGAEILLSQNEQVCHLHKNWINTLRKYATLITQSGEMQRLDYLDKQRGYIQAMGTNAQKKAE